MKQGQTTSGLVLHSSCIFIMVGTDDQGPTSSEQSLFGVRLKVNIVFKERLTWFWPLIYIDRKWNMLF